MENGFGASNISTRGYVGFAIGLNLFTAALVALRLGTNYSYASKLFTDDYLSVAALLILASYGGATSVLMGALNSPTYDPVFLLQLALACFVTGSLTMYFAKTPIIFLYLRVFGTAHWFRTICYTALIANAIVFLVCTILVGIDCDPAGKVMVQDYIPSCMETTFNTNPARSVTAVTTNVIMFFLPLPVICKLQLPLAKKLGIAAVFFTGILGIASAAVSLYFQWRLTGATSDMAIAMMFTCIESSIAIIVSCAPAFRCFWSQYAKKFALRPMVELVRSWCTRRPTTLSASQKDISASDSDKIRVTTRRYIELEDRGPHEPGYEARAYGVYSHVG